MNTEWAADNLQVIRTLMERSTIYRRALAPVMTVTGIIGLVAATVPCFVPIHSPFGFSLYWMLVALGALLIAFFMVRGQALKSDEEFWSPPTRRVTEALRPGFVVGVVLGCCFLAAGTADLIWLLSLAWVFLYGCAIHAAGFFMPRGIKLFGWGLVILAAIGLILLVLQPAWRKPEVGHYVMGTFFGLLHLAYGVYLQFTEKRTNEA